MIRLARLLVAVSAAIIIATAGQAGLAQTPAGKACALVTDAELQSALGSRVALKPGSLGNVQTCSGESPNVTVSLRLLTTSKASDGSKEKAGIEAIKKMGAQVDVKTSGGIMCMTVVPPASKAAMGFGTTCTVTSKAPTYAVIEITAKTQKDMVPMEKLRAVAEKMASRF